MVSPRRFSWRAWGWVLKLLQHLELGRGLGSQQWRLKSSYTKGKIVVGAVVWWSQEKKMLSNVGEINWRMLLRGQKRGDLDKSYLTGRDSPAGMGSGQWEVRPWRQQLSTAVGRYSHTATVLWVWFQTTAVKWAVIIFAGIGVCLQFVKQWTFVKCNQVNQQNWECLYYMIWRGTEKIGNTKRDVGSRGIFLIFWNKLDFVMHVKLWEWSLKSDV